MNIHTNFNLTCFNSLKINASSKFLVQLDHLNQLSQLSELYKQHDKILILGGGSNIVFINDFNGLTILNQLKGIDLFFEDDNHVYLKTNAGENWHQFVLYTLKNNWYGLENLSFIPGNVGAAPVQNIGAYGCDASDFVSFVEVFDFQTQSIKEFSNKDCQFGYRSSLFKKTNQADYVTKPRYLILSVCFKLSKKPTLNLSYSALQKEIENQSLELTPQNISKLVISIRQSKLPDPNILPNVGSFFINPSISIHQFNQLKIKYPSLVQLPLKNTDNQNLSNHNASESFIKLSAAQLIEIAGFKGKKINNIGMYEKHALILVKYGDSPGNNVLTYSKLVQKTIFDQFQIKILPEPLFIF